MDFCRVPYEYAVCCGRLVGSLCNCLRREKVYQARVLSIGPGAAFVGEAPPPPGAGVRPFRFPPNSIKNHKYNIFTFLPLVRTLSSTILLYITCAPYCTRSSSSYSY